MQPITNLSEGTGYAGPAPAPYLNILVNKKGNKALDRLIY